MPRTPGEQGGANDDRSGYKPGPGYNPYPIGYTPVSGGAEVDEQQKEKQRAEQVRAETAARNAAAAAQLAASAPPSPATVTTTFGTLPVSRNDRLHVQAQPLNLHGGGYFKPGYMRRVPTQAQQQSYDYRFYFLYNPYSLKTNMSANFEITPDQKDPSYNLFAGTQTVEFSVLLNRQMEQTNGSAALKVEGTLHDLEALYKVLNGDPQDLYSGDATNLTVADKSADMGFITPSSMTEFHFGPKLKYVGFVTGIGVEHKMFNNLMVPMLSEVGITFNRLAGVTATAAS